MRSFFSEREFYSEPPDNESQHRLKSLLNPDLMERFGRISTAEAESLKLSGQSNHLMRKI